MRLVDKGSTDEFPDGIAWKVMELSVAKCQSKDNLSSAQMKAKLKKVASKWQK